MPQILLPWKKQSRASVLAFGRQFLRKHQGKANQQEASLILAYCLQSTKESLYTHPEYTLTPRQWLHYYLLLRKRSAGIALAYIVGEKEFYGRPFAVNRSVLVPRPESETLVEAVLERTAKNSLIHDACTGSGCIAITLSLAGMRVSASDVSRRALQVCSENNRRFSFPLQDIYTSNFLQSVSGSYDVITANPPYLCKKELAALRREGKDPKLALFGKKSGMAIIQRLMEEAPAHLVSGGMLYLEIAPQQCELCVGLAKDLGYAKIEFKQDLARRNRVAILQHVADST